MNFIWYEDMFVLTCTSPSDQEFFNETIRNSSDPQNELIILSADYGENKIKFGWRKKCEANF